MSSIREYDTVRVVRLIEADRAFEGTAGVDRPPRIGDIATVCHGTEPGDPGSSVFVEMVDGEGFTIWLAEFDRSELELVDRPRGFLTDARHTRVPTRVLVSLALTMMLLGLAIAQVTRWSGEKGISDAGSAAHEAVFFLGWFTAGLGVVALVTLTVLEAGDRSGLWRWLNRPLVAVTHPASRVVRGIIRFDRWMAIPIIILAGIAILTEPLSLLVLAVTAGIIGALYLLLRRHGAS